MSIKEEEKNQFNLILVGDSAVGKTNLMLRFTKQEFSNAHPATIGVSNEKKKLIVDQKSITLNIWDTAGQERFKSTTESFFKKAHAIMLIFDMTARHTYENCSIWVEKIKKVSIEGIGIFLIGNQIDLINEDEDIQISEEEIYAFVEQYNLNGFFKTSALEGTNVNSSFEEVARFLTKSKFYQSDSSENQHVIKFKGYKSDQTISLLQEDSSQGNSRTKKCCCWR